MNKVIIYSIIWIAILMGCKIGKECQVPDMEMPEKYTNQASDTASLANLDWWNVYKDTILTRYIKEALNNNYDLNIAIARVLEYRASKRISSSKLFPSIDLYGDKEVEKEEGERSYDNILRGELSWELDLWGYLRWNREVGVADYRITEEQKNAVYQSLIADVATVYFELMAAKTKLDIIKQTVNARSEGVEIAKLRFKGGLTSEIQYLQAQVELDKTLSLVPVVKYNISVKNNDLYALLGQFPKDTLLNTGKLFATIIDSVPIGLPSDLLKRRPDIRIAEQELVAANAEVGVAFTNMFPHISLNAEYGLSSSSVADFFTKPYSFFSAELLSPLFYAGANKAKHKAAKAFLEQKMLAYQQAVINGFKETKNSIAKLKQTREVRGALNDLSGESKIYLELAQLQYLNGVVSYIDVLDAQRQQFDAELNLNEALLKEKLAYVELYKSLGGGW